MIHDPLNSERQWIMFTNHVFFSGDDRLEGAVLTELGRDTYREGTEPDAWRKMNSYARSLWSVAAINGTQGTPNRFSWTKVSGSSRSRAMT